MRKSILQTLFLSMFVTFLAGWAGGQSMQSTVPSSTTGSSSAAPTEQQEMRDELKALRAEVERLRAEVEQQKGAAPSPEQVEALPAPVKTGPGPNVPAVTAENFAGRAAAAPSTAPAGIAAAGTAP